MNPFKFTFILVSILSAFGLHGKMAKPNILWITSEDNSIEWVSCYGSKNAKTPHTVSYTHLTLPTTPYV